MSDGKNGSATGLERQLERLAQDVPPKVDLWDSIENAISSESNETRETWSRLPQNIEPHEDLWPKISSGISAAQGSRTVTPKTRYRAVSLLAACVACITIGGLVLLRMGAPDLTDPDGIGLQANTNTTLREHIALVREQREAIEASMTQYPNNSALRELWRYAYATELQLTAAISRESLTI